MASQLPSSPLRFSIAGAGRVATSIGLALSAKGNHPRAVWSRSNTSVDRATELLGCRPCDLSDVAIGADLVLIGVADGAIASVAGLLAEHVNVEAVYVHFAGSFGEEPLSALAEAGARVAAVHPVQACPSIEACVDRLPGSAWGVTCSEELREWVERLITHDLDGKPVAMAEADRPLWHAAAVTTSNGLAAVLAVGEAILSSLKIDPDGILIPLARGTLDNADSGGGGGPTLTGPVVRGEAATIQRHLAALRDHAHLAEGYRDVALAIVAGAVVSGRIGSSAAASIRACLEDS